MTSPNSPSTGCSHATARFRRNVPGMGSKDKGKREAKKPKKDKKAKPAVAPTAVIPPSTHQRPGGDQHA
jgi:hypothetical protein